MSPIISFNEKDLLRGKIITPAWYTVKVEEVGENPSKDQKSTNYPVEAVVIRNAENGDEEFAGVPISWMFNSKAMGFAAGYLKALGVEPEPGKRYELSQTAGKILDVFIENDEYEGRINNKVKHKYRQTASSEAV